MATLGFTCNLQAAAPTCCDTASCFCLTCRSPGDAECLYRKLLKIDNERRKTFACHGVTGKEKKKHVNKSLSSSQGCFREGSRILLPEPFRRETRAPRRRPLTAFSQALGFGDRQAGRRLILAESPLHSRSGATALNSQPQIRFNHLFI